MGRKKAPIKSSDSETEDTIVVTSSGADGVARASSNEVRAAAARDSELPSGWIESTKPTRISSSGRFSRPLEEPPMDGYVWNNIHGVWVPSGRYLEEIKRIKRRKPRKRRASLTDNSPASTAVASVAAGVTTISLNRNTAVPTAEASPEPSPPLSRSSKKRKEHVERKDQPQEESSEVEAPIEQPNHSPVGLEESTPAVAAASSLSAPQNSQDVSPASPSGKKKTIAIDEKDTNDDTDDDEGNDGLHPNSLWQEPNSNDLTLYEQHRAPRPAPSGTFICSMDALRQEFRCAICLDILRHARIVRECLHRFCESCMEQALTFQNVEAIGGRRKECPICRVYIPSRRSLAPDPYMDLFIARLLDNLVWEEENDPQVYLTSPAKLGRLASTLTVTTTTTSPDDNHSPEAVSTEDRPADTKDQASTPPEAPSTEERVAWKHATPGLIHIHLIQSDDRSWDDLEKPYITVAADAPTRVIQNFLRRKHGCAEREPTISVWTIHKSSPYVASEYDSLHYLLRNRSDAFPGQYMPLYYSSRDKAPVMQSVKRGRPRTDSLK